MDPLADEFEDVSPYNYGMNNPILMIDPNGMAADTGLVNKILDEVQVWSRKPASPYWKNVGGVAARNIYGDLGGKELPQTRGEVFLAYATYLMKVAAQSQHGKPGTPLPRAANRRSNLSQGKPALRLAYEKEVMKIAQVAEKMRAAGKSSEEIARTVSALRREIGEKYKNSTPNASLQTIYQRNIEKYGDKLGPSIDYLRNVRGKSWDDIINSASRPGGKDLGF